MKLETVLKAAARTSGVPYETILKDYAIGHLLATIAAEPALAGTLVMKGGTALRKLYFGEYRFSEDLDFTSVGAPKGPALERALRSVATRAAEGMSVSGPFSVTLERVRHKETHPGEQEDFTFRVQFPWQRQALCTVKVEITADEPVLLPTASKSILHGYGEELPGEIRAYALEEIVAEKLRSILQSEARRLARAWIRPRCRDYYDLWRVFGTYGEALDQEAVRRILPDKCAVRGVTFQTVDDFFPPGLVALVTDAWAGDLDGVVAELSISKLVLSALEQNILVLLE
ncbi:MAG: nucleotidyl transferase AbiEii/AbiGii toxin family protein [Acidobacteria bacterium]|nr:nucleotidyl transferase AbiEii/AbiGii toxin family protein [Acidobacteriota bacterium]